MSRSDTRTRHAVLGVVALSLFAALFTRLWYLQVLTTDEYDQAAVSNRTQTVILEAPRGKILDRNGNELVGNRRTIQVQIDYQDFHALDAPEQSDLLRRLATELTADQMRIHSRDASANDPGGDGPVEMGTDEEAEDEEGIGDEEEAEEGPSSPEGDEEGAEVEDEETTTTSSVPGEEVDPSTLPPDQRPPPAGVATGATNPDGRGDPRRRAPTPVTEEILRERIEDERYSRFKPVPVANDVSEDLEIYLQENAERFPAVVVERVTARDYRYGALLAHVLGYVAPVSGEDLDQYQNDEKRYENDDEIGKVGIERQMERNLRGTPGQIVYEVDARNQPIREVEDLRREPVPGDDVYLTIDINLQYVLEKGLATEIARRTGERSNGCPESLCEPPGGSSVAVNPQTGEVLAMASYPTYDPNIFIGGISTRDYLAMTHKDLKDVHHDPLLNRSIAGLYPPGSTFKLFSAYAGLATGRITPDEPYDDTGIYKYRDNCDTSVETSNCFKRNAGRNPNGTVRLDGALTLSSDTYFYQLGHRAWLARDTIGEEGLQNQMKLWGLGSPTGIDLPGERAGRIPTPDWLWDYSHELNVDDPELADEAGTWNAGISGNTVIGQGDVVATPLQMANGYATFANGGTVWRPQLVYQVTPFNNDTPSFILQPEPAGTVPFQPGWHEAMAAGFEGVTVSGTASAAFSDYYDDYGSSFPVAGKTGTAQTTGQNDSSLFAAYAPTRNPTIAMATVVEFAGFGSEAAVPVTRWVMDALAEVRGDLARLNERFPAPEGGWFDVEEAQEEFVPTVVGTAD